MTDSGAATLERMVDAHLKAWDQIMRLRKALRAAACLINMAQEQAKAKDDEIEQLRKLVAGLQDWCRVERHGLGNVDSYDYSSGQEYGLRRAEIEIEKRYGELGPVFAPIESSTKGDENGT